MKKRNISAKLAARKKIEKQTLLYKDGRKKPMIKIKFGKMKTTNLIFDLNF
jgi:hypothetical protein